VPFGKLALCTFDEHYAVMLIRDVSFLHFFLLTTRDIKRPRHYCGTWIDRWRILFVARRSSVAIPARLQAWMVHNHTETKCHMCVCFDINTSWCCYKEYTPKAFLFEPCCAHAASIFGKKLEVVVRTRIGLQAFIPGMIIDHESITFFNFRVNVLIREIVANERSIFDRRSPIGYL